MSRQEKMARDDLAGVLSEFARTMLTDFPIQSILDHFVKRIVDILPVSAAGVTLISPNLEAEYVAASDGAALRYEQLQSEVGEGPCLEAYRSGTAVSVPDLRVEGRFPAFGPRAIAEGLTAVFTFPLYHAEQRLGALDLYRDSPGELSADSMEAAQTLADVAAAYLINAQARSDLQLSTEQSREAALHDALTGLPNRVLMVELLEHAFRESRRSGKTSAVFFLDLDRFKDINDTYGHQTGDELLIAVAERLTSLLRPGDSLARLSGDEFVVLCENLDQESQALAIAERFDEELARPFHLSAVTVNVTVSIGVALTTDRLKEPEEVLHEADLEMYRSKRDRPEGDHFLDLRKLHLARHRSGLAQSLPGAIERGEFHLEYQPIVDAHRGRVTSVEALLRWTHPTRGLVSPAVFIPFAEQSGQIKEIGAWVLQQAWSDHSAWQRDRAHPRDIGMAVNVSPHQLMSAGFVASVQRVLDGACSDPGLLTLEVTEGILVHDKQRALIVLSELKKLGVQLALDDFGTGYSALGYLNTLPIDIVKVDHTFVTKLTNAPDSQRLLTSIIQLVHSLGMTVVSEGVETIAQHDQLRKLGSDSCQGFYYAKPMPATEIGHLNQDPGDADLGLPILPAAA